MTQGCGGPLGLGKFPVHLLLNSSGGPLTSSFLFIFENVKGLLMINDGHAWDVIKEEFHDLGYKTLVMGSFPCSGELYGAP